MNVAQAAPTTYRLEPTLYKCFLSALGELCGKILKIPSIWFISL
jgi:hypothetical protein